MITDDYQPMLMDGPMTIFSYCMRDLLKELFDKEKERVQKINEVEVIDIDKEMVVVNINNYGIDKNYRTKEYRDSGYFHEICKADRNNGVYARVRGLNAFHYSKTLSKYTDYTASEVLEIYKSKFKSFEDEEKSQYEADLAILIPKLYDFVIKNNQVKIDEDSRLKGYCDLDFYAYTYKDVFMISCYASATMYAVKFTDTGFKVYGENNDYGKDLEDKNNQDFDWDGEDFEEYFLKYLDESMIILEVVDNKAYSYNDLISMFHGIVSFICEEEQLV